VGWGFEHDRVLEKGGRPEDCGLKNCLFTRNQPSELIWLANWKILACQVSNKLLCALLLKSAVSGCRLCPCTRLPPQKHQMRWFYGSRRWGRCYGGWGSPLLIIPRCSWRGLLHPMHEVPQQSATLTNPISTAEDWLRCTLKCRWSVKDKLGEKCRAPQRPHDSQVGYEGYAGAECFQRRAERWARGEQKSGPKPLLLRLMLLTPTPRGRQWKVKHWHSSPNRHCQQPAKSLFSPRMNALCIRRACDVKK